MGNRENPPTGVIQIRRSRPSGLALALALMLTMLFVYAAALPALPGQRDSAASVGTTAAAHLRMEGLEAHFRVHSRCADPLQARIHAARCISEGGAGMILSDGGAYAVICETLAEPGGESLTRSAGGLTLKLRGSAGELAALADAIAFLRAQATETGSLARALEEGESDAPSVRSLLNVYRTQGSRVVEALASLPDQPAVAAITNAVQACLSRLSDSAASPAGLRLIHAAACCEWIALLEALP